MRLKHVQVERRTMQDQNEVSSRIRNVSPSATLAVDSKAKALKASGVDIIGYGAGEPDFLTPKNIVDAAIKACAEEKNYRYTPSAGLPELRQAIADKTLRDSGYEVDPQQIIITNGGKQAVYETFQVLLNKGDEVIVPAPFWTSYTEIIKLADGTPVTVFAGIEQGFEPSIEDIEAARTDKTKAIILNSPSNPTGVVYSPETIRAIGQWAFEHDIWVISDEIYEHLLYDNAPSTYVGAVVPEIRKKLIVLNGVAKTYAMTGWRVGWAIVPLDIIGAFTKLQGHLCSNVNNIAQRAAIEALNGPQDEVELMRQAFDKRRKTIVEELRKIDGVECLTPQGAFYVFPNVEGLLNRPIGPDKQIIRTSAQLAEVLLEEAHIAAVPGEGFDAPGYLRFSYALSDEALVKGMHRFQEWAQA